MKPVNANLKGARKSQRDNGGQVDGCKKEMEYKMAPQKFRNRRSMHLTASAEILCLEIYFGSRAGVMSGPIIVKNSLCHIIDRAETA